ncbi:MAG: Unknown protein [uncultured Thiotrichaceae bacterium]|uniref:DUF306 domain-containing protein n=1 Tax=uncultured Thiotrichaceae bacterium TaxID=298394 RepID=A0A6S6TK36_9GAMM|nr:MAG: Unknown protein [uncultured Thiotrichaceae bacterium]
MKLIMNRLKQFFVACLAGISLTACVPESVNNGGSALAGKWMLQTMNGAAPKAPLSLDVNTDDGSVRGFSGCNRFFARAQMTGETQLRVSKIGSTKKLCSDGAMMNTERAYLNALKGVSSYSISGNKLSLSGSAGNLVFTK